MDPSFAYSLISGSLYGSDAFMGSLIRATGSNVGSSYAIGQGTLSAGSNYTIAYTGSNFSITPYLLNVAANSGQSKVYGSSDPTLAYTNNSTLQNGDTSSVFTGSLIRATGSNVGSSYAIGQGTLSAGSNYTIAYTGSNFSITPYLLNVAANSGQSKVYGSSDPTLAYTNNSTLQNGDTSSVFTGSLIRATGSNVGSSYASARARCRRGATTPSPIPAVTSASRRTC